MVPRKGQDTLLQSWPRVRRDVGGGTVGCCLEARFESGDPLPQPRAGGTFQRVETRRHARGPAFERADRLHRRGEAWIGIAAVVRVAKETFRGA